MCILVKGREIALTLSRSLGYSDYMHLSSGFIREMNCNTCIIQQPYYLRSVQQQSSTSGSTSREILSSGDMKHSFASVLSLLLCWLSVTLRLTQLYTSPGLKKQGVWLIQGCKLTYHRRLVSLFMFLLRVVLFGDSTKPNKIHKKDSWPPVVQANSKDHDGVIIIMIMVLLVEFGYRSIVSNAGLALGILIQIFWDVCTGAHSADLPEFLVLLVLTNTSLQNPHRC